MAFVPFEKALEEDLNDAEFAGIYEQDREEFEIIHELIKARKAAKMTQQDVANKMKTSQSQIVRLESGKGTIASLRRYAKATGKRVKITLI